MFFIISRIKTCVYNNYVWLYTYHKVRKCSHYHHFICTLRNIMTVTVKQDYKEQVVDTTISKTRRYKYYTLYIYSV